MTTTIDNVTCCFILLNTWQKERAYFEKYALSFCQ